MTRAAPWVWGTYYHAPTAAGGERRGLIVAAGHIVGRQAPRSLEYTVPHPWEDKLRGFRFEMFGCVISQETLEAAPCPFWGLHVPNPSDYDLFDAAGLLRVAIWRWRAIHESTPVFAQVDWRPGWLREELSHGGVKVGQPNDNTRANVGLAILQQMEIEARHQVGRYKLEESPDTSWLLVVEKADDLKRRNPWMKQKDVALNVGVPERTLREYRRRKRKMLRQ